MTNTEPKGPTEFSWGRGVQPPPEFGAIPTLAERHRAVLAAGMKGRSEDPAAIASYDDYVREP